MSRSAALRSTLAPELEPKAATAAARPVPAEDPERAALLAEIRKWEGEPMPETPLALRLAFVWGFLVLAFVAAGVIWLLAPFLIRASL